MKHAIRFLFLAAGIGALGSEAGIVTNYRLFGSNCISTTSGIKAEVNQWGIYNPNWNQAMDVICPVALPAEEYYFANIRLYGYNRSNTDALSCTLNMSNDDGYGLTPIKAAVPKTAGPDVVTAAKNDSPPAGNHTPWVTCHLPAATGGSLSYLTTVVLNFRY